MKAELDKQLCDKYPDIFQQKDLPMSQTAMCWGFQHEGGWFDLVDKLCSRLDAIQKATGIITVATTVKEKYAELRFYTTRADEEGGVRVSEGEYGIWDDIIEATISDACRESAYTCEVCGEPGSCCRKCGWYQTLCKEHAKEEGYIYGCSHPYYSCDCEAEAEEAEPEGEKPDGQGSAG